MAIEQKNFSGVMNLDDAQDILPQSHHNYAMNVKFRGNGNNSRVENVTGNQLVANTLPTGSNVCVGAIFDDVNNYIYYFNYNSGGNNGIYRYDTIKKTVIPVLVSFVNSTYDIFNFDLRYPIVSINIMYKGDDGDELHWTDRNVRPQYLNVKDALDTTLYSNRTRWMSDYLTVAKQMPLIAPACSYGNDTTININNLKNKLYEFRYRYIYRDNTKSTWSPYSKLFAPADVDSLSTEIDPTKNNVILTTIETGNADCIKIELGARLNLSTTFGNDFLIDTIDKVALNIKSGSIYTYSFYNNGSYEYTDQAESVLLFDYVPKKANTQELINGNLKIFGGLTEGNTFDTTLDLSQSTSLITNNTGNTLVTSNSSGSWRVPTPNGGDLFDYYTGLFTNFLGDVSLLVSITAKIYLENPDNAPPNQIVTKTFTYNYNGTDTLVQFISNFKAYIIANKGSFGINVYGYLDTNTYNTILTNQLLIVGDTPASSVNSGNYVSQIDYTLVQTNGSKVQDVNSSMYKHKSRYTFGMVYFDDFGVTNGVVTNDNFKILTPEITSTNLGNDILKIPNIQFSINNEPPSWAKYFSFVRTKNITVFDFKTITTDGVFKDTNYGYIDITKYNTNTNNYPTYPLFKKGDRVRIIGLKGSTVSIVYDYPILGLLTTQPTGATWFPSSGFFVKLQYDATLMSGWGSTNTFSYYIEIYTPYSSINTDLETFYEFGETYPVVVDSNGIKSHGNSQVIGTTSLIPAPTTAITATLITTSGNLSIGVYKYVVQFVSASTGGYSYSNLPVSITTTSTQKQVALSNIPLGGSLVTSRRIYRTKVGFNDYYLLATINNNTATTYTDNIADTSLTVFMSQPAVFNFYRGDIYERKRDDLYILDESVSDKYDSKISGNGRPFAIDPFAKEIYNPTLVRYSGSFQQGTLINETNRFYFLNFEEYDRQKGSVQRMKLREKVLRIFQERGTGVVNVYATEMTNQDGSTNLIGSTKVLNPINYYAGRYGIGNQYLSLCSSASADYFCDPVNGYHIRLAGNGNTALTELYKGQYYFPSIINKYLDYYTHIGDASAKILGVYDNFEEEYVSIMQSGTIYGGTATIPAITVGFSEKKNCYTSFYSYEPEFVINAENTIISWKNGGLYTHDSPTKNTFYGVNTPSAIQFSFNEKNVVKKTFDYLTQDSDSIWNSATMGDVSTSLNQSSNLVAGDYEQHEGFFHGSLMRDNNSLGGIINGDYLKGTWVQIKLSNGSTNLVSLSGLYMGYQVSPRNF